MECIINIIKFLDKHNGFIMCFLTFGIMILAAVTAYIANQKRKDDLFKIRWEFYQEIVNFIEDTYYENCIFFDYQMADHNEHPSKKQKFLRDKTPNYPKELTLKQYYLISKIKNLFDAKIANLIQEFISDFSFELIAKSAFQQPFIDLSSLLCEESKTNEKWTYSWLPSPEFEQLFDEYLKLDNQFLKRFF